MKALSLHQPWASLVALGVKTIETRSWATKYRGPLLIHAAKRRPIVGHCGPYSVAGVRRDGTIHEHQSFCVAHFHREYELIVGEHVDPLPLGAVVASCVLADCVPIVAEANCTEHPDVPTFIAWSDRHQTATWLTFRHTVSPSWFIDKEPTEQHRDQIPFGDFSPGRYAWLLEDVKPIDPPILCRGRQGLWNYSEAHTSAEAEAGDVNP